MAPMLARAALVSLLLAGAVPLRAQEAVEVAGVVVDGRGRAIRGAKIGSGWWFDHGRMGPYGVQDVWPVGETREANRTRFVRTDVDGRFRAMTRPERRRGPRRTHRRAGSPR